ncbi:androgen-induced gene 1 protein-like [Clavelina lepadiformis]|uniref:androgen-induced gene 1 protein-like n=1 Tax=Clavelina lepadiformis TaxID=159417 RepID=UPI004041DA90
MTFSRVALFHALAWIESLLALHSYHYFVLTHREQGYGGPWKYLTYLNMVLQLIYFSLCVGKDLVDYLKLRNVSNVMKNINDVAYAAVALPSTITVFVSFWAIYLIDREMIHPEELDEFIPQWANHMWHTAILVTIAESYFNNHKYPRRRVSLTVCSFFGLLYVAAIFWIHHEAGFWVYPFMDHLHGVWMVLFIVAELVFTWVCYFIGEAINSYARNTDIKVE